MQSNERELVQRCLDGEPEAMRAFVRQFEHMVFGLSLRMLGHRHDAEDISQEVFLRVFRHLHRWDPTRALKPWILTITANRCRTALSQRKKTSLPALSADDLPAASASDEPLALAEELQLGLDQLREEYRTCFILYYQQELSHLEIAEVMDCPEGTVKTWLFRARNELAEWFRRRGVQPEIARDKASSTKLD